MKANMCPCKSSLKYGVCCKTFHEGRTPKTPMQLVRSRYSAYVLNIPNYIIKTTHPLSARWDLNRKKWEQNIFNFSKNTTFTYLKILDFEEYKNTAVVIFFVEFLEKNKIRRFVERSFFEKIKNSWLYKIGNVAKENIFKKQDLSKILPIAYFTNPIFQKKKEDISKIDDDLKSFINKMKITCSLYNGIGLAACQVNSSKNLFIKKTKEDYEVFINPKVLSTKGDTQTTEEGCISIPSIYGKVLRKKEIILEYVNFKQETKKQTFTPFESKVIFHETDHLKGLFFIDSMDKTERKSIEPALCSLKERISHPSLFLQ